MGFSPVVQACFLSLVLFSCLSAAICLCKREFLSLLSPLVFCVVGDCPYASETLHSTYLAPFICAFLFLLYLRFLDVSTYALTRLW